MDKERTRESSEAITADDVAKTYQVLLGRDPEGIEVVKRHMAAGSHQAMVLAIINSDEARNRLQYSDRSPFFHYNAAVDVPGLVLANVDSSRVPREGHSVNFLGVAVPTEVFDFLAGKGGTLDVVPIPANYHADMSEWAAAIRAIDLAQNKFTMIELGSGWGCWMVNTGVLAKRKGLALELIGVEADPKHIAFCQTTMNSNSIPETDYSIVKGIASADTGTALFPKRQGVADSWGFEPVFGATKERQRQLVASGKYEPLPLVPLKNVIADRSRIDLLHIDIQGGETDLVRGTLDLISDRVAYVLIGTHSRMIEGDLMKMLLNAGWMLEIERPAIFKLNNGIPQTTVDGVQGWRNPKFEVSQCEAPLT